MSVRACTYWSMPMTTKNSRTFLAFQSLEVILLLIASTNVCVMNVTSMNCQPKIEKHRAYMAVWVSNADQSLDLLSETQSNCSAKSPMRWMVRSTTTAISGCLNNSKRDVSTCPP